MADKVEKEMNVADTIKQDKATGRYIFPVFELMKENEKTGEIITKEVQIQAQKMVQTRNYLSAYSKYTHDGDIVAFANVMLPSMVVEPVEFRNVEAFGADIEALMTVTMGLFTLQRGNMNNTKRKLNIVF